jgi:Na+/proline symporter
MWGDMVREYAPAGLFGLLLVSCLAGYMAAISSIGNWSASYLMNDFYRRSLRPHATNRELVLMSRVFSGILLALAFACGALIDAKQLEKWVLFINSSLVVFSLPLAWLKWFWWRLNVVGDMVGILGGFPAGYLVWFGSDAVLPQSLRAWLLTHFGWNLNDLVPAFSNLERFPFWIGFGVLFILGWIFILAATFLTRAESFEVLRKFYISARPIGWWGPVRRSLTEEQRLAIRKETRGDMAACACGIAFYFALTVCLFAVLGGHKTLAAITGLASLGTGLLFVQAALSRPIVSTRNEPAVLR